MKPFAEPHDARNALLLGASYFFRGTRYFLRDVRLWKSALPALPATAASAAAGVWLALFKVLPFGLGFLDGNAAFSVGPEKMPGAAELAVRIGLFFFLFRFLIAFAGCAHEMLNVLLFAPLAGRFMTEKGIRVRPSSLPERADSAASGMLSAIGSLSVWLILALLSWFSVYLGLSAWIFLAAAKVFDLAQYVVPGYRFGVACMVNSAEAAGVDRGELRRLAAKEKMTVIGFGVTAYVFQFANVLTSPGAELGGAMLFHDVLLRRHGEGGGTEAFRGESGSRRMEDRQFIS